MNEYRFKKKKKKPSYTRVRVHMCILNEVELKNKK